MVWKDVTEVGCAWTYDCADPGWAARVYFTCEWARGRGRRCRRGYSTWLVSRSPDTGKYSPPGNIVGEEATEVGAYIGA